MTLLRAWDAWRGTRLLPRRQDMILADLTAILSRVVLFDFLDADRIIFRVAGTALCDVVGRELRGCNLLDFAAPEGRGLRARRMQHIVARPCGAVISGERRSASGMKFRTEALSLPIVPARPDAAMQIIGVISLELGQPRPSRVSPGEIGVLPEAYRFLDIGAGLPSDP
jgi:hypothetical protein